MSLTAKTILDQQEIRADGVINLRFAKQITNGDTVLSNEWHRTALVPGTDIDKQTASVSGHLVELGYPPVSDSDVVKIKAIAAACWTDDVIAAWQASKKTALTEN